MKRYTSEHHISTDTLKLTKSQTREARFTLTRVCDEENLKCEHKISSEPWKLLEVQGIKLGKQKNLGNVRKF